MGDYRVEIEGDDKLIDALLSNKKFKAKLRVSLRVQRSMLLVVVSNLYPLVGEKIPGQHKAPKRLSWWYVKA